MRYFYRLALVSLFTCCMLLVEAQTTPFGKVLYRVNNGGTGLPTHDTSSVNWSPDYTEAPSAYIDTVGSKTYGTYESITLDASIDPSIPEYLLQTERGLWNWKLPMLSYNFPVSIGQKVEVRLYFAELYVENPGERIFDVSLEGNIVLDDFDIFAATGGMYKGTMKSFQVSVEDGNLDVDFLRGVQQPKVNAIEIVEVNDAVVQSLLNKKSIASLSVYPNPCKESISIHLDNLKPSEVDVFDVCGLKIHGAETEIVGSTLRVNLSSYNTGIYFVRINNEFNVYSARVVKE